MSQRLRFVVSLDDVRNTRRLRQRRFVLAGSASLVAFGLLGWWFTRSAGAWVVVALALLALAEWRFAPFDSWFDRRRSIIGSECEIDVDEAGISFHQTSADEAWETSGRIAWSAMTGVKEDERVLLILQGRSALVGIPKRAFPSGDAVALFRSELSRHVQARRRPEPPGNR